MKSRLVLGLAIIALATSAAVVTAAIKEAKDATCTVYFCCEKCVGAFKGDSAKFAAKAHQQMVSTGQLVQKGCPFSGGPVKPGTQISIGDAEVGFCCPNCKGKVEKASPEDQVTMVFGTIDKGFKPAAK
jgi:hypothetical protein